MAFVLELGGIDRSTYYMNGSFALRETLGSRSTADFALFDAAGTVSVEVGTEAKLTIDDVVVFSGSVQSTNTNFPSMNYSNTDMTMRVSCVDHNEVLDRRLVSRPYSYPEGITYGDIVKDLISRYLAADGIVEGQIQSGQSTKLVTFNYETVNSILEKLAGAVGYVFYVDYNKALHFRDRINIEAPYEITSSAPNYRSLTVNETRSQYRNRQYLRGGMQISPNSRTEVFAGDSVNRTFTVSQPIGAEPIIEVIREGGGPDEIAGQWNRMVVGLDGNDGNPEVQWTWKQNEREVTQDSEGDVLKTLYFGISSEDAGQLQREGWDLFPVHRSHDFLRVTYQPLVRILARRDDDAEIASRAAIEGNSGLYESIEEDERVLDSSFAQERVRGMLNRFGNIPKVAHISTDEPGIRAGQLQRINLSKEGLPDSRYLIESVAAKDRGDFTLTYTYKALDGESLGGWQEFFRKLLDKNKQIIGTEGEVVMMFNDPQASVTLSDNLPTPTTSNTLGSYTVDPYTVCLVNANSTVGASFPTPLTYAETILQASPTLYYRFDEIASRIETPFGTGVNVQDSSLTGNSGTSFYLLTGVSPGAVGEDPIDVFEEITQSPGRRRMRPHIARRGQPGVPEFGGFTTPDVWNLPTPHAPGRFAPESNFPSICCRFPPPITGNPLRVMAPSSVLNGEADTTIEFWVNAAQVTHEMNLVNAGNAATTLEELRIVLEANASPSEPNQDTITVRYYDQLAAAVREVSWPGQTIRTLNPLEAQTPHVGYFVHIALVRNEAENLFELFINGNGVGIKVVNSVGDRIALTNMVVDANGLVIGQKFSGDLGTWDVATGYEGMLDEFAIFTKVLSDGEIADHSIPKRKRYYTGSRIPATGQPTYMGL